MLKRIFGDASNFAIQYQDCPDAYNHELSSKMAICHLMINGQIIGKATEECYLPTWLFSLTDRRNRIDQRRSNLFPKEFEGLSDREIFELILKANQLEEEFRTDFLYLPQPNNEIWGEHHFTIDETIDGYLICFYVRNDRITFLIENLSGISDIPGRNYQFMFHTVDLNFFMQIVDEMTHFLVKHYPYLQQNVSDRKF